MTHWRARHHHARISMKRQEELQDWAIIGLAIIGASAVVAMVFIGWAVHHHYTGTMQ